MVPKGPPYFLRFFYFLTTFAMLGLFFNNCSSAYDIQFAQISSTKSESGNGYGYGGKPSVYYRFLPDFSCNGQVTALASIEMLENKILFTENNSLRCGNLTQELNADALDTSPIQSEVMGYQDGLYMGFSEYINGIPDSLAEVWCRDFDKLDVDIITYFNPHQNQAKGKIYSLAQNNSVLLTPEFSISRAIDHHKIMLESPDFHLIVDRDVLGSRPLTFQGEWTGIHLETPVSRKLSCKLGSAMDPRIWPALMVNPNRIVNSQYDPVSDQVFFTMPQSLTQSVNSGGLYGWRNGKLREYIKPGSLGGAGTLGIQDFKISPKGIIALRSTDRTSPNPNALRFFSLDPKTENLTTLSPSGKYFSHGSSFGDRYQFDPSGRFLYFLDDALRDTIFGHTDLFASNLEREGTQVSPPLEDRLGNLVSNFQIGMVSSKVLYFYSDSGDRQDTKMGIFDPDTHAHKLFTKESLGLAELSSVSFFGEDHFLLINSFIQNEGRVTFGLDTETGSLRKIRTETGNTTSGVQISEPTGRYLGYSYTITTDPSAPRDIYLRDTSTWNEYHLGATNWSSGQPILFDEAKHLAYKVVGDQAIQLNLDNGERTILCSNLPGEKTISLFKDKDHSSLFIASSKPQGNTFQIRITEFQDGKCLLRNSFPSKVQYLQFIDLSPKRDALLAAAQLPHRKGTVADLIHIPLNGRPIVQVNHRDDEKSGFYQAHYTQSGQGILFYGTQPLTNLSSIWFVETPMSP